MIRDYIEILAKAEIMVDRIEFAHEVLQYDKTAELHRQLIKLLENDATTHNCAALVEFIKAEETTIHAFDSEAINTIALIQKTRNKESKEAKDEEI